MKAIRILSVALLGVACSMTASADFTLTDLNTTVIIDPSSQAGMHTWSVDGVDHMFQQWFWYRVGDGGPESSVDTLTLSSAVLTGTTDLALTYTDPVGRFTIDLRFILTGGTLGSGTSDVAETIRIRNTGAAPLPFRFFQYSDYDMGGTFPDDTVIPGAGPLTSWEQFDTFGASMSENVATSASRYQASLFPVILISLNDGASTTLTNTPGPLTPLFGDATWGYQWNVTIGVGGSFLISKDKRIVPEPGTLALGALGLGLLATGRRRFA